jgi:hypothetical protein
MARIADYAIVTSGTFSLGSNGGAMGKAIQITLPENAHAGSRSVLSYMIRDVDVGDIFKIRIKINNKVVASLSYDDTQFGLDRMLQTVVGKNVLKAGKSNAFLFEVQNESAPGGKVTFSDVVITYQVTV